MSFTYDMAEPDMRTIGINAAVAAAHRGQLVVFPTDTVYGVGADAFSRDGIDRLRTAKGRGREFALPVLVGTPDTVDGLAHNLSGAARRLVEAFWPGGLTLVVAQAPSLAWDLGDAHGQVALRMPLHPVALELLRLTGPMAVTSANVAGSVPPVTAADAEEQLGTNASLYLDAGPAVPGLPSTIVDATGDVPRLLRPGAVDLETLRSVCPDLLGD